MTPPLELRDDLSLTPLAPGDGPELCDLFRASFGRTRTPEAHRWRFEEVPGGGLGEVARREGKAVAFFGALPMDARLGGDPVRIAQGVDSMVHPEHRAGLQRPGLLVRTATRFFDVKNLRGELTSVLGGGGIGSGHDGLARSGHGLQDAHPTGGVKFTQGVIKE